MDSNKIKLLVIRLLYIISLIFIAITILLPGLSKYPQKIGTLNYKTVAINCNNGKLLYYSTTVNDKKFLNDNVEDEQLGKFFSKSCDTKEFDNQRDITFDEYKGDWVESSGIEYSIKIENKSKDVRGGDIYSFLFMIVILFPASLILLNVIREIFLSRLNKSRFCYSNIFKIYNWRN